jgi:lipoprotein-releasing system permease protein
MLRPVSLFVGLRYTRAKRRNHFISFIALASMIGIALGVTVLITVLSVMNGFERELQDRILGMAPHIIITGEGGRLENWQQVKSEAENVSGVAAATPYIATQGMLRGHGVNQYALVQGINPEFHQEVSIIDEHMVVGDLRDLKSGEFGMILGSGIARRLGMLPGDKITLIAVEGTTATPVGISPRMKRFTVSGIFEVRAEVDSNLVVIHIDDAAKLLRFKDQISGIRLKADQVLHSATLAQKVSRELSERYFISDWSRSHGSLFKAIKMEKTMMFILLTFIIAVAAFNIVSTLVMVVTDKQSDIAILRTLGASPGTIMNIFMIQGSVNGLMGTLFGLIGGVSLSLTLPELVDWLDRSMGISLVPGDVYFVSFLPSQLQMGDVINVALSAFFMSLLATLYPAWRAARIKPAEALRYE